MNINVKLQFCFNDFSLQQRQASKCNVKRTSRNCYSFRHQTKTMSEIGDCPFKCYNIYTFFIIIEIIFDKESKTMINFC